MDFKDGFLDNVKIEEQGDSIVDINNKKINGERETNKGG